MLTVNDILHTKQKAFNVIQSDALVIEAVAMLSSVNLSYLIVLDGDEYKGIFSERDYARNIILKGRASNNTMVKDAMTTDLPMVNPTQSIKHCMRMMISHKTRYLLAYEDNKFLGVITIHDLLRQVLLSNTEFAEHNIAHELIDNDENVSIF